MKFNHSLSRYILENTTEAIFRRGIDYAGNGKISRFEESDKKISGCVSGSKLYAVEFRQGPVHIKGYCDCPYFQSNSDYCKHIAALAVWWDTRRNLPLPSDEEITNQTIQIDYETPNKIKAMFNDPLNADLTFLARVTDQMGWARPHAKLPIESTLNLDCRAPKPQEIEKGLAKISRFGNRSNFDSYFCAGEISAILSLTYDEIASHLKLSTLPLAKQITTACIAFYYDEYLEMIDGSDGIWEIPKARLPAMIHQLCKMGLSSGEFSDYGRELTDKISGWDNIYEDLGIRKDKKLY